MKLLNLAAIVAGAGIAQVIAVPLLVIPNSNAENTPSVKWRLGYAVPAASPMQVEETTIKAPKVPCPGRRRGRFHHKAVEISNAFRKALGLPPIQVGGHPGHVDGRITILPVIGSSPIATFVPVRHMNNMDNHNHSNLDDQGRPRHVHHVHHNHHGHRHAHHRLAQGPFIDRIHYSLMNLGRWEGRAVAFVLGCGIGVLLRMFWVLALVMYRTVRGQRSEQYEYSPITVIEQVVVDTPRSAPPTYTYPVDEKVAIPVEVVIVPTTTEESK